MDDLILRLLLILPSRRYGPYWEGRGSFLCNFLFIFLGKVHTGSSLTSKSLLLFSGIISNFSLFPVRQVSVLTNQNSDIGVNNTLSGR